MMPPTMTDACRRTGLALLAAAMVWLLAATDAVHHPARAEAGLPAGSSLKLGKLRRDADGRIILDTSRAAIREARRERRQWRGTEAACRASAPPWIRGLVESMAPQYGLDTALVLAVIAIESNYQVKAVSPKNAQGLMQLIPATARRFGVSDPFDPAENVRGGLKYLRWLMDYFGGNLAFALAGYNAGEKAVDRYRGIPPYAETQHYVRAVQRQYRCGGGPAPAAKPAVARAAKPAAGSLAVNPWAFGGATTQ